MTIRYGTPPARATRFDGPRGHEWAYRVTPAVNGVAYVEAVTPAGNPIWRIGPRLPHVMRSTAAALTSRRIDPHSLEWEATP